MVKSVSEFDAARERLAGVLTMVALVIAFAMANSPLYEAYWFIHHAPVSVQIGGFGIDKSLNAWINKGLLVFFFLLIGLEIKREMLEGRLAGRHWLRILSLCTGCEKGPPVHRYVRWIAACVPGLCWAWCLCLPSLMPGSRCRRSAPILLLTPLSLGIVLGLFLGKQLGIFGMAWLAVRLEIEQLPSSP